MLHCDMVAILAIRSDWLSNPESDVVWRVSDCHYGHHLGYWKWTIKQFWISMSPWCLPSSFCSICLTVWEETGFCEFQDGGHLGYWNRTILAILISITPKYLPPCLSSIRLIVQEQMWFEDFQDGCHGGHLGYQNGTILAILNLHSAPMPSTKFPLYLTYC